MERTLPLGATRAESLWHKTEVLKFAVGGQQFLLTDCSHALESLRNHPVLIAQWLHWVNYRKKQSQMTFPYFQSFLWYVRELEALQKAHFSHWVGVYQAVQGKQKHKCILLLAVFAQNCSSETCSQMWVVTKEVRKAISDHSLVLAVWTHGSCLPREDMRLSKLKKEWNRSMGQESSLDFSFSGFSHERQFDQKETVEWCAIPSFNGLSTWLPAFVSSLYSIQCLFNVKKNIS